MEPELVMEGRSLLDRPIEPRTGSGPAPLTDSQAQYWRETLERGSTENKRLRAAAIQIMGELDTELLRDSIAYVCGRHESLRTRIVVNDATVAQCIDRESNSDLRIVDLSNSDSSHSKQTAQACAKEFFDEKVDLLVGPLFANRLLKLSDRSHVLLLGLDHMVSDGTSCGILSREIWSVYSQLSEERSPVLPNVPIQLADYATWLDRTTSIRKQRHRAFWIDRMTNTPTMEIPDASPAPEPDIGRGQIVTIPFGRHLTSSLRNVARTEKTLFPLIILAVHILSMSQWCRQNDMVMIFASHGRHNRPELFNMIGFLVRALYFRIEIIQQETLADLLARVSAEFFSVTSHQLLMMPLPKQCNPSFLFNWGGLSTYSARWSIDQQRQAVPGLRLQPFDFPQDINDTFFPFFSDTPSGVALTAHYRPDLLPRTSLDRFAKILRAVGHDMIGDRQKRISELPIVS